METADFLDRLRQNQAYKDQIAHIQYVHPRMARYGELDQALHPELQQALEGAGFPRLYIHQAQAINAALAGRNAFVVTPSASGKTLCYNVPVLDRALRERRSRALYLFPTKALAQDQLRGLNQLASSLGIEGATFDGDTPVEERGEVKRSARLVLTNPDMLHLGILPNHESWSGFLRNLRYVIVDEAHIYRGVFGSHVANVLRRLRRLCDIYGSAPQFICCSATIANPREHIEGLVGLPFDVIDEDGSPYGGKDFVFWNPPIIDSTSAARRSANTEATLLFTELVKQDWRTIAFARARKLIELIYIYSRDLLEKENAPQAQRISPYRAGYLPQERREIERRLFDGELLGIVSTSAMELGVDIGDLDATVLTGYPGSIASAWQQAGRSGRRGHRSLSFLVALDNPLDQYLMRHPDAFFDKAFENAITNKDNPYILKQHLLCAAWERPLDHTDGGLFSGRFAQARDELTEGGSLKGRKGKWYPSPRIFYPAEEVNIRSTTSERYAVIDTSRGNLEIDSADASVAFLQVHPGAVYLHQGESYLVTELDIPSRTAYVKPVDVDFYTQPKDLTDISITEVLEEKEVGGVKVYLGEVDVTMTVVSYRKRRQYTEEITAEEPLDLPPQSFTTVALWFDIPKTAIKQIEEQALDFAGGLHAAEHAAIAMLPLYALCDRNDIGGLSTPAHPDTGKPQIFIYDAHPGGIGISEKGYQLIDELWNATLKAVAECPCSAGCPSCIQSPKCGNNNEPLDKRAAQVILEALSAHNR
jgi:DEAD/DEAH box helicase domain-containing protein